MVLPSSKYRRPSLLLILPCIKFIGGDLIIDDEEPVKSHTEDPAVIPDELKKVAKGEIKVDELGL